MAQTYKGIDPMWLMVATALVVGLAFGGIIGYLVTSVSQYPQEITKIHPAQNKFRYINPLLATEVAGKQSGRNSAFVLALQGLISRREQEGKITDSSIYFRDIESGAWAGINEEAPFSPGRLLKVPIMITYFKLAEGNPAILQQKLILHDADGVDADLLNRARHIVAGKEYTVEELIKAMIIDSDDRIANVLFDAIDKDQMNEVFSDLGINFKEDKGTQDFIPLKLYGMFFRLMYNATYLNREYSEKALEILVQTDDTISIGSQISRSIPLADMSGARPFTKDGKKYFEMYDCGIFYYPGHPYLLCVTAQGTSLPSVGAFLGEVGARAYAEVNSQYK